MTECEKAEPKKTECEKTEPEKIECEKAEPEKDEPEKTEPQKAEPEKIECEKDEPEKDEPEKAEPTNTEPKPCVHCGRCMVRCEVLLEPRFDMGDIDAAFERIMALPPDERTEAVRRMPSEEYFLYNALRRCCLCGYCTEGCPSNISSAERMKRWRPLFAEAGLMPPDDSKLTQVDNEWNIFSAYRAIYGIAYPEFISLEAAAAAPGTVDTLFFPGCSLASYTPEVMRAVGAWLNEAGVKWAVSLDCCGSPLMSMGLPERAEALKLRLLNQMETAGITRMLSVCPGCDDEFRDLLEGKVEIVPLPALMEEVARTRAEAGEPTGFNLLDIPSAVVYDSCHDRKHECHGRAIRKLFEEFLPDAVMSEMDDTGENSLCCGAGGAVAGYDAAIGERRIWRVIDEACKHDSAELISICPTCTYTIAQALLNADHVPIGQMHYLEVLLGVRIDWKQIFNQLESMWYGEYGPWLSATFF